VGLELFGGSHYGCPSWKRLGPLLGLGSLPAWRRPWEVASRAAECERVRAVSLIRSCVRAFLAPLLASCKEGYVHLRKSVLAAPPRVV
jgi:hypothetical protein